MIKKLFLVLILLLVAGGVWFSADFKEIAAGVSILLFGMVLLEKGFQTFAEGPLKRLIKRATNKFYKSMGLGMISTALLQSSSLISVIAISFISAGILNLTEGIGIIFGANIGTTATAWLVSGFGLHIKISVLAMPMLIFGVILIFQKKKGLKALGNILAGLGFFFLGIHFMKEGFDTFKDSIQLSEYTIDGVLGIVVFVGIGILATVILQSSSATMAIILTALAAGQVTYPNALAMAIGANVGTTITAILGAAASNAAGKQVAGAHLIFNVVTAVIAIALIHPLRWAVDEIAIITGIAADNYILKLSIFHTIFNVIGVIVMYPFVGFMAKQLQKFIRDDSMKGIDQPKYLSDLSLKYPHSAINALFKETEHLLDNASVLVTHSIHLSSSVVLSQRKFKEIVKERGYEKDIDVDEEYLHKIKLIYSRIIEFATLIQEAELRKEQVKLIYNIKDANRCLVEIIKDIKDFRPNMNKYLVSDNEEMKAQYNLFRKRITKLIREMYHIRTESGQESIGPDDTDKSADFYREKRKRLKKQLKKVEESDVLYNGTLDRLIRSKAITSDMASSLINDSGITGTICKNLVKITELLYLDPETRGASAVNEDAKIPENDAEIATV